jgi:predicted ester cyclase
MSTEENKAIARLHFEEAHNKGRVELFDDYYALDVPADQWDSKENYAKLILWWRQVAPDWRMTILDMVAEGDKVFVYHKTNLTYSVVPDPPPTSPMPPLGKPVEFRGVEIMHFANGKLIHDEFVVEWMSMMADAGVYVLAKSEPT